MNIQEELQQLEIFLKDADANASEIIRIYSIIAKENSSDASNAVRFLNKSAALLLSPELVTILKKHRTDAYSYILVANNLLDLEDVKDDLCNGNVLTDNIPPITCRKLKAELSLGAVANASPTATAPSFLNVHAHEKVGSVATQKRALATEVAKQCRDLKNLNGMLLYKLPLKPIYTFSGASSFVKRFSFGEPSLIAKASKTILLMGATGSGKTTMINAMINYVLGVEWEDPFRFLLIDEDAQGANQALSQTREVTAYDIHYRDGFRVPFSLTIVDTPGFGDTDGVERDMEITTAIKQFFEHSNGIQVRTSYYLFEGFL